MNFYNYIENARYEMLELVNGWTREGAETKARIMDSLDKARWEYTQNCKLVDVLVDTNEELRKMVRSMIIPLNPAQRDWLDKTFTELYGEGLYAMLERLGIEVPMIGR